MKLMIDTARDNPRLIRAAVQMVLAALDNGDALPASVPAGLILTPHEEAGRPLAPPPPPIPAPSTAVAAPPPIAPDPALAAAFGTPPPPVTSMPVPPPAPPAVAPPALAAPSSPAGAVALDRDGFPWDSRIHSASHACVADGTWKLKKGMSLQKAYVDSVRNELRATMAIPSPAAAAVNAAPPPPPPPAPAPLSIAPPPPPAAMPDAAPADDPATFPTFMSWIAGLIGAGKWSHAQSAAAAASLGLPSVVGLSARPDLIPSMVATVRAMLPA